MKSNLARLRAFKSYLLLCALLFPLFWIVLGGMLRSPLLIADGAFAIYLLRRKGLLQRLGRYGGWALAGLLLTIMGLFRMESEPLIFPVWYILAVFYCVPAGIFIAHCGEEFEAPLNAIFAAMMLLFGLWSLLVMQQLDLTTIVRMTQEVTTRLEQKYPVELFGIFSWENVKMQLIPWSVYPFGAVVAIACRNSWVNKGMILAGATLAAYVAGAFLTRTVFLAGGVAIGATILLFMIKAERKRQFLMLGMILFLSVGVFEVIQVIPAVHESVEGLLDRFSYTSDDTRQYLWESAAKLTFQNPLGGGDVLLQENLWAHNLPLDMGLLYGIPGFLTMSWLLIALSYAVVKWAGFARSKMESVEVLLFTMFIGAMVSCMVSPPDIAFLTPLLLVATFARERVKIASSRMAANRHAGLLHLPQLAGGRLGLMARHFPREGAKNGGVPIISAGRSSLYSGREDLP